MVKWPEDDLIRFVEWRVRAFEFSREERSKGIPPEAPDHPLSELDLKIWLQKVKGKKSLSEIARKEYPRAWKKGTGKRKNQLGISRVRNALGRVERFLNRDGDAFTYPKAWQREINSALENLLSR